jgi:hypothetical protein
LTAKYAENKGFTYIFSAFLNVTGGKIFFEHNFIAPSEYLEYTVVSPTLVPRIDYQPVGCALFDAPTDYACCVIT